VPDVLSFLPGMVTNELSGGYTWIYKLKLFRYMKISRSMDKIDDVIGELGKFFKQHTSYNIRFVLKFLI
jgi:hypothetical protein